LERDRLRTFDVTCLGPGAVSYCSAPVEVANHESYYNNKGLDPYVAKVLAQEPAETQRTVIGILNILKSLSRNTAEE